MRLAWASDIHLNFVTKQHRRDFLASVNANALVITGDLTDAPQLPEVLADLPENTYFVLGNHDSYHGSLKGSRYTASKFSGYLSTRRVKLTDKTYLVGVDGWGDCRCGNIDTSRVCLNDWLLIEELRNRIDLPFDLRELGDREASILTTTLSELPVCENLLVATHVPPFACNDPDYQPYYTCKAVGDVLLKFADQRPECKITILCGHTHLGGEMQITDNMQMLVAKAEYRLPKIQQVLDID